MSELLSRANECPHIQPCVCDSASFSSAQFTVIYDVPEEERTNLKLNLNLTYQRAAEEGSDATDSNGNNI